jgi:hypothetical protein
VFVTVNVLRCFAGRGGDRLTVCQELCLLTLAHQSGVCFPLRHGCSCAIYCASSRPTHVLVRPIWGLYFELPPPLGEVFTAEEYREGVPRIEKLREIRGGKLALEQTFLH